VIVVARPEVMPETMPLSVPIVAADGLLLVHDPPATTSESVIKLPAQTFDSPVIEPGALLTVTVFVVRHPAADV
jgi:hypothetical protein